MYVVAALSPRRSRVGVCNRVARFRRPASLDGPLLGKLAATEAKEIAQRLLIESNVSRHERPTERKEERKGGTTRGLRAHLSYATT